MQEQEHTGPIESAVCAGYYWASETGSLILITAPVPESFVVTTGWIGNNCVITSQLWKKYVKWTDDGEIVISDIDSSREWDSLWPDEQNHCTFPYSEPVFGCFRLQTTDGRTVKYINVGGSYLSAVSQVDDFSLFKKTWT
jgi:hypothetical protein